MKTVLMPLPQEDFDPTEAAVSWKILKSAGHAVKFATPAGRPGHGDARMLTGEGLGLFAGLLRADARGLAAYRELEKDPAFLAPLTYAEAAATGSGGFDALVLPGGHAPGMKPYLESPVLQQLVAEFFDADRPVGAVCHGVVLAARSRSRKSGRSVLHGRRTTALTRIQELTAWNLTRARLGNYFRTYPQTVEAEVRAALASPQDFSAGPVAIFRDSPARPGRGFVVRDGNYVSARWPGDIHRFGAELLALLAGR